MPKKDLWPHMTQTTFKEVNIGDKFGWLGFGDQLKKTGKRKCVVLSTGTTFKGVNQLTSVWVFIWKKIEDKKKG